MKTLSFESLFCATMLALTGLCIMFNITNEQYIDEVMLMGISFGMTFLAYSIRDFLVALTPSNRRAINTFIKKIFNMLGMSAVFVFTILLIANPFFMPLYVPAAVCAGLTMFGLIFLCAFMNSI